MIENYLKELEKVLNDNAYDDVQSVIEYMREFAEDKKEEGETEEDIIASFGTVEDVASSILQKEIKTKEIASSLKEIDVRMMSADITFQVKDVNDVEVNFTDPKRFTIIDKEHILRIQEKKLKDGFFFGNHSAEVIVNVHLVMLILNLRQHMICILNVYLEILKSRIFLLTIWN